MPLTLISGGLGSGKSLFLTRSIVQMSVPSRANYEVRHRNALPFDLATFIRTGYSHCAICLDEAYMYLESRCSGRGLNRVLSYLLFQSRKSSLQIFVVAQLLDTIDVRFRMLADYLVECQQIRGGFSYDVTRVKPYKTRNWRLSNAAADKYFAIFDTLEHIVNPEALDPNAVLKLTALDDIPKLAETHALAMLQEFPTLAVTHDVVDYYLFRHQLPTALATPIYLTCKIMNMMNK